MNNVWNDVRCNPLGIQMLPEYVSRYLFGDMITNTPSMGRVQSSIEHLKQHGIQPTVQQSPILLHDNLKLPDLFGRDISEHFYNIANHQVKGYKELINNLNSSIAPRMPESWSYQPGWTKYTSDGNPERVDYPNERVMVLDVEVCVKYDHLPIIATAVSPEGWYSWISNKLYYNHDHSTINSTPDDLISVGPTAGHEQRLVVGHNVSYDRARIKEEYNIHSTNMRFLDTLSLHVCVAGQTTIQKALWKKAQSTKDHLGKSFSRGRKTGWIEVSSPNSLDNVYQLYCGEEIDKSPKDIFIKGSMADVRDNFQYLMKYCANDVKYTKEVLEKLYCIFCERCPHPASLVGLLEMSSVYLPVNKLWNKYIDSANYVANELENELSAKLMEIAEDSCTQSDRHDDVWLRNLDWKDKKLRRKGQKMTNTLQKLSSDNEMEEYIISSFTQKKEIVHLPGYPEWYRLLCDKRHVFPWKAGPCNVSSQMRISPYLLKMKWNGHPLYYNGKKGWGYIIPIGNDSYHNMEEQQFHWSRDYNDDIEWISTDYNNITMIKTKDTIITLDNVQYYFIKLPHKDGPNANCGNPLSKEYLPRMEDGVLTSEAGTDGQRILTINSMISSWRGAKQRIGNQFVVWLNGWDGVILPQIMPAGTATRRAVEKTWLTASNAKKYRVGSELRALVQAPRGYNMVGADVDSQELWIASLLGDSHFNGMHGCTALSWMTLQGNKSDCTDMHSKTASTIGITRDQAKIFNYGRMYGAGKRFAEVLLKQFNPLLTDDEITEKASTLYKATKGDRRVILSKNAQKTIKQSGVDIYSDGSVEQDTVYQNFSRRELLGKIRGRYWSNGTESSMFNKLESIANTSTPATPVLKCRMSKALEPKHVGTDFMTSRANWVVQSSAVDYLHLIIVSMKWLMEKYKINGRLCISIHDEVRYLVESDDKYKAALALQLSNLFTRSLFAYEVGIPDLPMNVAFFSSVDIDDVLRKEVSLDCETPSNPHGLSKGYNIPNGEALDIVQLLKKINT